MKFYSHLLTLISSISIIATVSAEQMITDFSAEKNESMGWHIVNDGVMGGLSKGNVDLSKGGEMKFHGDLSLENNGGFSLVRSKKTTLDLSNYTGITLRIKGDGRTYQTRLTSDAKFRGFAVSFSGEFKTKANEWVEVKIPFSSFKGSFRGMDLPEEKLNPADIRQVGIIIADKKQAPFTLEVDWIKAY